MKGFHRDRLQHALRIVESAVVGGEVPGAVVLVGGRDGDTAGLLAFGGAALAPAPRGRGGNSAGDLITPGAIGHTGFTGTSLRLDPALGLYGTLLTNRVHRGRERTAQAIVRPRPRLRNAPVGAPA